MFFVTLAAALMLAGADQAQPAQAETAAAPAAAAPAEAAKPKVRKVCYVEGASAGSRMTKKRCVTQPIEDQAKAPETK